MQLSHVLAEAGGTPQSLEVTAAVEVVEEPAGGLRISGVALTVVGEVEGLDAAGFDKAAQEAKQSCPVSKALSAIDITLDASLA
jgi:osmotically inducible protein OsmC